MRWRRVGFVFAIGALLTGSAAEKRWPRFEDYPAKVTVAKRLAEASISRGDVVDPGLQRALGREARGGPISRAITWWWG